MLGRVGPHGVKGSWEEKEVTMHWELASALETNQGVCLYRCWDQRKLNLLEKGRKVMGTDSLVLAEAGAEGRIVVLSGNVAYRG